MSRAKKFTGDTIRREIIDDLSSIVGALVEQAKKLDEAIANKQLPEPFLPVNPGEALTAIKTLRAFVEKELRTKLSSAIDGAYRYPPSVREAEGGSHAEGSSRKKARNS